MAKLKEKKEKVLSDADKANILNKYKRMKKLKEPKKPKFGKKPKKSASINEVNKFLGEVEAKQEKYDYEMKVYNQIRLERENTQAKIDDKLRKLRY